MEEELLPEGFEWCRKGLYEVQMELGCYPLGDGTKLLDGFKKDKEGKNAVKSEFNKLEQQNWTTSPNKPYIITGTVGERWPVKQANLSAYEVDPAIIGITPITASTKDPSEQEFLVAYFVPEGTTVTVTPSWAFNEDGSIDQTQLMVANSESSIVPHNGGDYVVAKHIPGEPEYMELLEKEREDPEIITKYDPRIVNGSVMQTTYDRAKTQAEIKSKYQESTSSITR